MRGGDALCVSLKRSRAYPLFMDAGMLQHERALKGRRGQIWVLQGVRGK